VNEGMQIMEWSAALNMLAADFSVKSAMA